MCKHRILNVRKFQILQNKSQIRLNNNLFIIKNNTQIIII